MKKILFPILTIVVVFYSIYPTILKNNNYFRTDYWERYPYMDQLYRQSQYVNKETIQWIPDEAVNAYAGGAYVQGISPVLIAPDTPPLGRYLIGISALVFGNEHIVSLLFFLLSFFMLFITVVKISDSVSLASLTIIVFSFERIIINQLVYTPLLDIIQMFFLLVALYFFMLGYGSGRNVLLSFVIANISSGLFMGTKFFMSGITIPVAWGILLIIRRDWQKLILLIITIPVSFLALLASYVHLLIDGYSVQQIIGVQKWVYLYHQSQIMLPLSVWPLLFLNKWYVWFGQLPVISDPQWSVSWPIVTAGTIAVIIAYVRKYVTENRLLEPYLVWAGVYVAFLSVGQTTSRYLIILLPVLYVIVFTGLYQIIKSYEHRN